MSATLTRRWLLTAALLAGVALPGCGDSGPPRVKIRGKVTDNGQPLKVPNGGFAEIAFIPVDVPGATADPQTASISPTDGSYELIGTQAKGVLLGKYKITVRNCPDISTDLLKGKFDQEHSKIEREVTAQTGEINIDLSKPTG